MQEKSITPFIFARELAMLMERSKTTQARVAEAAQISQPGVAKWLKGKTVPQGETLMRLARFFDVLPQQLLDGGAKPGSFTKKYLEEHPRTPGPKLYGGGVPIMPHPLYRELSNLSAQMMDLRGDFDSKLAGLNATKGKLDNLQSKIGELLQQAAALES